MATTKLIIIVHCMHIAILTVHSKQLGIPFIRSWKTEVEGAI